jgi:hypothetical protein
MDYYAIEASRSHTDKSCLHVKVATVARQNRAAMSTADCVSEGVAQVFRHADELKNRQQQF